MGQCRFRKKFLIVQPVSAARPSSIIWLPTSKHHYWWWPSSPKRFNDWTLEVHSPHKYEGALGNILAIERFKKPQPIRYQQHIVSYLEPFQDPPPHESWTGLCIKPADGSSVDSSKSEDRGCRMSLARSIRRQDTGKEKMKTRFNKVYNNKM